jgi:hypothetical protein
METELEVIAVLEAGKCSAAEQRRVTVAEALQ